VGASEGMLGAVDASSSMLPDLQRAASSRNATNNKTILAFIFLSKQKK
jgi:hypothetical protein